MRAYVRAACSQYERFEFKDDIVKKNWIRKYWDENNALWMKWFHGGRDWNKVWIHLWVCVCVWLANAISIMNTESEWHSEEGKSIKIENAI